MTRARRRVVAAVLAAAVLLAVPAFAILEDFQEESKDRFQAAMGMWLSEWQGGEPPEPGFGVAVDDVVLAWREFRLDEDPGHCDTNGACATIQISQTNLFDPAGIARITVLDRTPYSTEDPVNDCNGDGDFTDAGDVTDCDGNLIPDVVVEVSSEVEANPGERLVLNRTATVGNGGAYAASIPYSFVYDVPGVLFLQPEGSESPTITARYADRNIADGALPSVPCPNDQDPQRAGTIETSSTVHTSAPGALLIHNFHVLDNGNGDGDAFADTNETLDLFVTLVNDTGTDFDEVTLALSTTDTDKIDCIIRSVVEIPGVFPGEDDPATPAVLENFRQTPTPFRFHVRSDANRTDVMEDFRATFRITAQSAQFDSLDRLTTIDLDLDLSASGGGAPTTYFEDFEGGGLGSFTSMSLDVGLASLALSDGYRCQYNDPFGPNPNQPGRPSCFLGFTNPVDNAYDWHLHAPTTPDADGGRAYSGVNALHLGVHDPAFGGAHRDTERLQQLDAIRTTAPIHIGASQGVTPELTFKHQASMFEDSYHHGPVGVGANRGVVHVQLADPAPPHDPVGDWIKIYPYRNDYDAQAVNQFFNCIFDPTDDGNDEDSYFDPTDPNRHLGPSSACYPEFSFSFHGDTDWRNDPGIPENTGRPDGPGLLGDLGPGTWVEPRFNLSGYLGRSLRLRFLYTSIELEGTVDLNDTNIGEDNSVFDDGWYIDDIVVTDTLTSAATLVVDGNANTGLPGCTACTSITPALAADATELAAPGRIVELDASASSADACNSGILQFLFFADRNGDGAAGPGEALRDWSNNPIFVDAPVGTTRYGVRVRCSSDPACAGAPAAITTVRVLCPSSGTLSKGPFPHTVTFSDTDTLSGWPLLPIDAIRGDLDALRASGGDFSTSLESCLAENVEATGVVDTTAPIPGTGKFYLVRESDPACNAQGTFATGTAGEAAGRDAGIESAPGSCP